MKDLLCNGPGQRMRSALAEGYAENLRMVTDTKDAFGFARSVCATTMRIRRRRTTHRISARRGDQALTFPRHDRLLVHGILGVRGAGSHRRGGGVRGSHGPAGP